MSDHTIVTEKTARQMARTCSWITAVVLAAALPSGALAQGSDAPGPSGGAATDSVAPQSDEGPSTLPIPPVTFSAFVDLAQGYSTNAGGISGGGNGSDDTFSRGRIGASLRYNKPRLQADVDYLLTGEYWAKFHRLNHLSHRLNLASRLTVVPEMLFLNANAFATPAELTRAGELSASGEPISRLNTRDTYGYVVQPEFLLRFDDFATSTTTASHGGVFFVRPSTQTTGTPLPITPAENSLSTTLSEQITSGTYFDRLQWNVIGSYMQSSQTVRTQTQEEGLGNLTYALTRVFRVFAIGGYSNYKSTTALSKDLSGPTALGGITYTLGPDFEVTAEAGTQHNFPTYMGSARWAITPLTRFVAEATDSITTPQGDILSRLGQAGGLNGGFGGTGGFGDTGGLGGISGGLGLGSFGGNSPFGNGGLALDNSIYRMRSANASLIHTVDRMQYTISAFGSERDRLDIVPNSPISLRSSVYGVRGAVSRTLNINISATLSAAYSISNEFGGHDNIFSGDAGVTYHLSQAIDLYLTNHFVHRDSARLVGFSNEPLTEDQVLLGIRARI